MNPILTLSLLKPNITTIKSAPHLGEAREIEAEGMKAREIEPTKMEAREIEPAEMKVRGTEAKGMDVGEIEAVAKDTVLSTAVKTRIGHLYTIGDISEIWSTMRDIKMNTLAMGEKHLPQAQGVNLNMRSGTTSMPGG